MYYRFFDHMGSYWPHSFFYNPWGIVLSALAIAAVVVLVVVLVKALKKKNNGGGGNDDVLEILKTKYVSGEITEEEYMKKKKILSK